jgi:hypothetical protein
MGSAEVNHFEALANAQMVAATKAKHRAAEKREAARAVKVVRSEADAPMKLSGMEQEQADQSKQLRLYKAWKREEARLEFEHRPSEWTALSKVLRNLTIDNGDTLLDYIKNANWLHAANHSTRRVVLSLVANRIIRVRLENGYAPMDDSALGEAPTLFEIIRNELKVLT